MHWLRAKLAIELDGRLIGMYRHDDTALITRYLRRLADRRVILGIEHEVMVIPFPEFQLLVVGIDPSAATWEKVPAAGMSLAAAILFGLSNVLAQKHPLQLPPTASVAWQALLGMILVGLLAALEHPTGGRFPSEGGWRSPTSRRFR